MKLQTFILFTEFGGLTSRMKTFVIQLAAIFCIFCNTNAEKAAEVNTVDEVLVLTESNFDQVIASNKHVLVEFCKCYCLL